MFRGTSLASIILLICCAIQHSSFAQIINEKTITNIPYVSLLQYSDNEYIYVGTEKNSPGYKSDVTLTKKDVNGDIKWKKTIDWQFDCTVKDAVILSDKCIVIAGSARTSAFQSYPFVMKTDPKGDMLWARYYKAGHQAEKVIETHEGGFLFAYYSNGSVLMKLNADGDSIWSVKAGNGKPSALAETAEAAYLLVEDELENIVLSSIGSYGEVLWKWTFGGPGKDQPVAVLNANSDDYLFAGSYYSDKTKEDFYIGLVDCFGSVKWTKTFGGPGTDLCFDFMHTSNGEFIAVGVSNSFNKNGKFDFYAVKLDKHGNAIWTKTIPTSGSENFLAKNVFETSKGSFLLAGPKLSDSEHTGDSYLVEFIFPTQFDISFESDKQIVSNPPFSVQFTNKTNNSEYYDFVWHFGDGESLASDNNSVLHEYKAEGLYNVKLVAIENDFGSVDSVVYEDYIYVAGDITSADQNESIQTKALIIQPNPFTDKVSISFDNPDNENYTLRIIDLNGKLIKRMDNIQANVIELNRSNLHSGIYFIELSGRKTLRGKLLVE